MFKGRLGSWNFRKYLSKADWQVFAVLQEQRRAAGKPPCKVEMHNRIRSEGEFARYLRQQRVLKATFLAEALSANLSVPEDIRCLETTADPNLAGEDATLFDYLWQLGNPASGIMPYNLRTPT
jgi:hypothetical protein